VTVLGVVCRPQLPPERLRSVARAADSSGLEELWLWEDCFLEGGVSSAAAALACTERLRLGIGLMPAPLRNVALAAMEVATIERMFPGRLLVGVGHGVQDWMLQVGARVASPLTLLCEYVAAMKQLLAGEEVNTTGRYVQLERVRLGWPPASPPPLLIGASQPRSLRLSGQCADGTILTAGTSPHDIRNACGLIAAGRADAGNHGRHAVVVYLHAATGPGALERLARERARSREDPRLNAGVAGGADVVAAAVRQWSAAGATTVVLQPTADEPDPEGFVRFVAGEVRALSG